MFMVKVYLRIRICTSCIHFFLSKIHFFILKCFTYPSTLSFPSRKNVTWENVTTKIVQYSHYTGELGEFPCLLNKHRTVVRNGSRTASTSKMERFVILVKAINYYHKALYLGCCSSPRSDSGRVLYSSQKKCLFIWKGKV